MASITKPGFIGKLGGVKGAFSNALRPVFAPLLTTLSDAYGNVAEAISVAGRTRLNVIDNGVTRIESVDPTDHVAAGTRVVENLASGTDVPVTQTITVTVGNVYRVGIGRTSATGSTCVISGAASATLTGDATNLLMTATLTATTTSMVITITGSVTDLHVVDVTGLPASYAPEYVPNLGAGTARQIFTTTSPLTVSGNIVKEFANTGRDTLINNKSWTIIDGGSL